ncbi:hypothetical protein H8356DRAFT_1420952, partial [Neocallimastix lanati (nom. inval.)]
MDNSFNMKNYDLSNISSKNNLFLEDIDTMMIKLDEKRRNAPLNNHNSKKRIYLPNTYDKGKKSPKFKLSNKYESSSDYNTYHQNFHEYSKKKEEHENDIYNLNCYNKIYRNSDNFEKNELENMNMTFYTENNDYYGIKNEYNKRTQYKKENYDNRNYSINSINNTEYGQDYYPVYLSEPNKTNSNYYELNESNKNLYTNNAYNNEDNYNNTNINNDEINMNYQNYEINSTNINKYQYNTKSNIHLIQDDSIIKNEYFQQNKNINNPIKNETKSNNSFNNSKSIDNK